MGYCVLVLICLYFLISLVISSWTHWFFKSVLCNFLKFVYFNKTNKTNVWSISNIIIALLFYQHKIYFSFLKHKLTWNYETIYPLYLLLNVFLKIFEWTEWCVLRQTISHSSYLNSSSISLTICPGPNTAEAVQL